jgi:hypothetical protein
MANMVIATLNENNTQICERILFGPHMHQLAQEWLDWRMERRTKCAKATMALVAKTRDTDGYFTAAFSAENGIIYTQHTRPASAD